MRRRFCNLMLILVLAVPAHSLFAADTNADLAKAVEKLQKEVELLKKRPVKIAVVSDIEVAKDLEEWTHRQTELEAAEKRFVDELKLLKTKIDRLTNTLSVMVDGPEKSKKREERRSLEDEYRAIRSVKRKALMTKRDRYLKRLQDKMIEAVTTYADKHGYAVVILKDALLYSDKKAVDDISQKIIDMMNTEYIAEKKRDLGDEPDKPGATTEPAKIGPELPQPK